VQKNITQTQPIAFQLWLYKSEYVFLCNCRIKGAAPYVEELHLCDMHADLAQQNRHVKGGG